MKNITTSEKCKLRSKAHSLKPIIIIGNQGLTENILKEIDRALHDHELIKIRIYVADKNQKKQMIEAICNYSQTDLIQAIGSIIVIYRKRVEQVS